MRSLDRRSWEITFSPPFSGTHGGKKVSRRRTIYKSTLKIMSVWKVVLTWDFTRKVENCPHIFFYLFSFHLLPAAIPALYAFPPSTVQ